MSVETIIRELEALTTAERRVVRAVIDRLDGAAPESGTASEADSAEVRRVAAELMTRFAESMRKLANR